MNFPLFSIIIPTKNRPELLRDAILSVLFQNFDDYELIVSDNSTDNTSERLVSNFLRSLEFLNLLNRDFLLKKRMLENNSNMLMYRI